MFPRLKMDELWVIIEKKLHREQKMKMKALGCG